MKPLLSIVVTICLVVAATAHPENIEDVKELPQTKEPIVEAEESQGQPRVERCSACEAKLHLNAPLASLQQGEIHTSQSFEGCSSENGCAGVKVKDGKIVEKYGNLEAFQNAAASSTSKDYQFHTASALKNVFEKGLPSDGPFWWMNQNSPFKNSGGFQKYTSKTSSYTSNSNNGGLSDNIFLNGEFAKATGFDGGNAGLSNGNSGYTSSSSYNTASFGSSSSGSVNAGSLSENPFLTGQIGFNSGSASNTYSGSSPRPFTASTAGSNINLIQTSQKEIGYQGGSIDDIFANSGNVRPNENAGDLQQTCSGQGYVCVSKSQCNNGVVNTNGGYVPQASSQKQYCNVRSEICCRLETSSSSGFSGFNSGSFGSNSNSISGFSSNSASNFGSSGSTVSTFEDNYSAGSVISESFRPGASGSNLKPGIPYLPPVDSIDSQTNVVSSTVFPTPTFVTTSRPFSTPRPIISTPGYLPPSTAAPGYLPPEGESTNNKETRVPNPTYTEGEIILDETRQPPFRPPPQQPPQAPSEIPAGCAAALKCTPIEYCTAEGVISNTTVVLTRDQESYRVPLTDCKDLETGRIGKCCRDPYYTDPWPVNQLGKWVPGVFGGNDGKYVPDNRGSNSNTRPTVTGRPPVTGSLILNVPRQPNRGANQYTVTPAYNQGIGVAGTGTRGQQGTFGVGQQTTVGVGEQATVGIGQQGSYGVGQQGTFGIQQGGGGRGDVNGGGAGIADTVGAGSYTGAGVAVNQGQYGVGTQKQFGVGTQTTYGKGVGVITGQGTQTTTGVGQIGIVGQGIGVQQGYGQQAVGGQGVGIQQGGGLGVQQGGGLGVQQGGGLGVQQGGGYGIQQGGGSGIQQGGGYGVQQGAGTGIQQGVGIGTTYEQGQAVKFGQGSYQTQQQGSYIKQGTGQAVIQGTGQAVIQGVGTGIKTGQGYQVSQGGGYGVENEGLESVQRVFLQKYNGGGQCGLLNPQKPYGNKNDLEVDFAEIPWQAMILLQTNKSLLCGGVITRPDVVITSAACVEGLEAKNVLIKGGEWKLGIDDEPLPFQIVQVKHILRHPFYKKGSYIYDAAILVLTENLRFSKNIYPICLPSAKDSLNLDAFYNGAGECLVTGWGKTVLQAHLEGSIMHAINVSLINPGECQAKLSSDYPHLLEYYDSESCACGQPTNPLNNICKVDIGSALACTTDDSHFVLRGIYSWDSGCQIGNQIAAFYKFDIEWYEWALGFIESVRFVKFGIGTKVTQTKYTTKVTGVKTEYNGVKGFGATGGSGQQVIQGGGGSGSLTGYKEITSNTQFGSAGTGINSGAGVGTQGFGIQGGSVTGYKGVGGVGITGGSTSTTFGVNKYQTGTVGSTDIGAGGIFGGGLGVIKGIGEIKEVSGGGISGQGQFGQTQFTTNQFGTKYSQVNAGDANLAGLNFGGEIKGPISNSFSATYSEKKVFQSEPQYVTYTTKPEIVTFTTKPEYYTFTTKPKFITYTTKPEIITYTTKPEIVTYTTKPEYVTFTTKPKLITYTTKPQLITYETSGSGTNPQYVAPGVSFNPSFTEALGQKHSAQCKCLEHAGKK